MFDFLLHQGADGAKKSLCIDNVNKQRCILAAYDSYGVQSAMWLYRVFQNGLVFVSLVAGMAIACHLVYCRSARCRNWLIAFTTITTGFFHMMMCLYLLGLSELSGYDQQPNSGQQDCVDYSSSANVANVIILTLLAIYVIKHNFSASLKTYCAMVIQVSLSTSGLLILTKNSVDRPSDMRQNVFLTFGKKSMPHVDVFWSVCQKMISHEQSSLLFEYCLVYLSVTVTVLIAWYRTYRRTGDIALIRIKVLEANCYKGEFPFQPCICTKLNTTFVAVLFYSFIVIFIGRPAMIIYGHMTSGYFRDILPSLLQTVMYCFICSEYIMWCYRLGSIRPRQKSMTYNTIIKV